LDLARPDLPFTTGTIYANTATTLYTVDPDNFELTPVGNFDSGQDITDIAVAPDGKLVAISFTSLYSVNSSTANETPLFSDVFTSRHGLTLASDGRPLAVDATTSSVWSLEIGSISLFTSQIGSYGSGFGSSGDLVGLADGELFGTADDGPLTSVDSNAL